jgi:hypothetical protein
MVMIIASEYVQQELFRIISHIRLANFKVILGKGHWKTYIKQKARSLNIDLPKGFNPESYAQKVIKQKLNKPEAEQELAFEWIMGFLFLSGSVSQEKDLFQTFEDLRKNNPDRQHNFAGLFASSIGNAIKKYMRFEGKRLEDKWDESDAEKVEERVRNIDVKYKHEENVNPKTKEKIPFGLTVTDVEKIQSLDDIVSDIAYKDLKRDLLKYVKDHDHSINQFPYKTLRLLYEDQYDQKEIAEKLNTTPKTVSVVINQKLKRLVAEYGAMLKKKYKDPTLYRLMLNLDLVPEGIVASRRMVGYLHSVCTQLESIFI